jgi:hypothetical protein
MSQLKTICAWCGTYLSGPSEGLAESHGICAGCLREQLQELNPWEPWQDEGGEG